MSLMRVTAVVMILLLASQAGAAVVCPAECAPVAMPVTHMTAHHGHQHHLHADANTSSISAAQCSKLMIADSALASANRAPEFVLDSPVAVAAKSVQQHVVYTSSIGAPTPEGSSPPQFFVLRI
jgi:hypothetical protein